jgi:hypothetical protein
MAATAGTMQLVAQVQISGVLKAPQGTGTVTTIPGPNWSGGGSDNQVLSFGTASGLADIFCCAPWTIAASGDLTFDLFTAGTDFPDVFGNAAIFAKIKAIYVQVKDGTGDASGVVIGNPGTNANALWFGNANDTWTISDGGPPFIGGSSAGVAVDNTHKVIKFHNAGAVSATIIIALVGSTV